MYFFTCLSALLFALIFPSFRFLQEGKGASLRELGGRWPSRIMVGLTLVALTGFSTAGVAMTGGSSSPNSPFSVDPAPSPPVQNPGLRNAEGATTEKCANEHHILPPGNINTDLEINGVSCTVDGSAPNGTYVYRNVNIWGGGTLNFADAKIDFHAHSILVENRGSLYAGLAAPTPHGV